MRTKMPLAAILAGVLFLLAATALGRDLGAAGQTPPQFGPVRLWNGESGYPAVGVTADGRPRAVLVDEEGRAICAPSAPWPR